MQSHAQFHLITYWSLVSRQAFSLRINNITISHLKWMLRWMCAVSQFCRLVVSSLVSPSLFYFSSFLVVWNPVQSGNIKYTKKNRNKSRVHCTPRTDPATCMTYTTYYNVLMLFFFVHTEWTNVRTHQSLHYDKIKTNEFHFLKFTIHQLLVFHTLRLAYCKIGVENEMWMWIINYVYLSLVLPISPWTFFVTINFTFRFILAYFDGGYRFLIISVIFEQVEYSNSKLSVMHITHRFYCCIA